MYKLFVMDMDGTLTDGKNICVFQWGGIKSASA